MGKSFLEIREWILDYLLIETLAGKGASTALPDNTHLVNDLGMDSVEVAELILKLERAYKISFDGIKNIHRLKTLGTLTQLTFQAVNRLKL